MHRKSDLFLSGIQPVSGYSVVENALFLYSIYLQNSLMVKVPVPYKPDVRYPDSRLAENPAKSVSVAFLQKILKFISL